MWTSADVERMTPEQVKRLTEAGDLKHLLAGNELPQAEADALKRLHGVGAEQQSTEEWLASATPAEIRRATEAGKLNDLLGGAA